MSETILPSTEESRNSGRGVNGRFAAGNDHGISGGRPTITENRKRLLEFLASDDPERGGTRLGNLLAQVYKVAMGGGTAGADMSKFLVNHAGGKPLSVFMGEVRHPGVGEGSLEDRRQAILARVAELRAKPRPDAPTPQTAITVMD